MVNKTLLKLNFPPLRRKKDNPIPISQQQPTPNTAPKSSQQAQNSISYSQVVRNITHTPIGNAPIPPPSVSASEPSSEIRDIIPLRKQVMQQISSIMNLLVTLIVS